MLKAPRFSGALGEAFMAAKFSKGKKNVNVQVLRTVYWVVLLGIILFFTAVLLDGLFSVLKDIN